MSTPGLQVLRNLIFGVRDLFCEGVAIPNRSAIDIVAGPAISDDAVHKRTRWDFSGMTVEASGWRSPVRFCPVAALPAYARVGNVITTNAPVDWGDQDGVTPAVGNRVLLRSHVVATPVDAWIYDVTQLGSVLYGFPLILTRASDSDTSAKCPAGARVAVQCGNANKARVCYLDNDTDPVLNTTQLIIRSVEGSAEAATCTTTDGTTWVELQRVYVRNGYHGVLELVVVANDATAAKYTYLRKLFALRRDGGTATLLGPLVGYPSGDEIDWRDSGDFDGITVAASGTDCVLTVRGTAATTVIWHGTARWLALGPYK
jgi:hypothetical protein